MAPNPEDELWKLWPNAAWAIFKHKDERGVEAYAFGLDSVSLTSPDRLVVTFSRMSRTGSGRDKLYITATRNVDDTWSATHTLQRV